ncbi:hypothetical protein E2P64_05590 [Candidatus Bathyarchaeota archaeon]|nr:hypothetical protein E2P64_05590 [Candidatus Bathyarchaeota archaeon]
MQSLADKLKALGVQVGTQGLQAVKNSKSRGANYRPIDEVLSGHVYETRLGSTLMIQNTLEKSYKHGEVNLASQFSFNALSRCSSEPAISELSLESFAFIDTETTGLMGGTGTYAFLIGVGRFISGEFQVTQILMRDPAEEPAQLVTLEEILAPSEAIVTFNGKSFDIPLLKTRYKTHRWPFPLQKHPHIDMLHLARRLWKDRLSSRALGNLEVNILGAVRTEEDIPGWAIPQLYFDYLMTGDASPLKRVVYHNSVDIVSLAALFSFTNDILTDPLSDLITHDLDIYAIGKLFEDAGEQDMAAQLFNLCLSRQKDGTGQQTKQLVTDVLMRLALIYKRNGNFSDALPLWEQAADNEYLPAYVEIAKYYEHRQKENKTAQKWTNAAINLVTDLLSRNSISHYESSHWLSELEHRQNRIRAKILRSRILE